MKRGSQTLILVLLLSAASACHDASGPDLAFRFQASLIRRDTVIVDPPRGPYSLPPTRAEAAAHRITVRGYLETPCSREKVRVSARRDASGVIRIRVRAERTGGTCAFTTDPYTYVATVDNVAGPRQRVVVEHLRDARRADGAVLDTVLELSPTP
jgi:hypothetical protein